MTARGFDPVAQAGRVPEPDRRVDVLVVGGGPAGATAAIEAARGGAKVLLVDENPLDAGLMGLDTPLYFGGRYTAAVHTPERLTARIFAANPLLEAAIEAGAEVELGVCCWGAWVPGYGLASLPGPLAGLADTRRAWMVGFERIVVAAGARDVAFSFQGWDQPGVMGARALAALMDTYEVFTGRRLAILGSGELGLRTALAALRRGLEVAAVIEVEEVARGPADLQDEIARAGVTILTGWVPVGAPGGIDGVTALEVRPRAGGAVRAIACDTIVQAISLTPAIELLDVLGVELAMRERLGGHAPVSTDGVTTSLPQVFIAGDVAGVVGGAPLAYQKAWMDALMATSPPSTVICQCEGVTWEALLAVRPPAYLGAPSPAQARRDLASLLADGPPNPDQVKRLTRAGMGPCQGRRCREQVALVLAGGAGGSLEGLPRATYRAPVRPLALSVLAAWNEPPTLSSHWDVWMGIPGQWTPYDDIGTEREALSAGILGA